MAKIIKYGFWVFLLAIFTLLNLLRTNQIYHKKEIKSLQTISMKRISSLMTTNIILKRKLEPIEGQNITTLEWNKNLLKDSTLVILLYEFKCDKCQENELKRINTLYQSFSNLGINILGITTESEKDNVLRQKKTAKIDYPIYVADENDFFNIAFDKKEFPQVLFIAGNIIIAGFIPIPRDDKFSEDFYKKIINKFQ